jgi:murein DD-endopeptidase MepM/ murein hydrolase activator NlpD
LIIRLFFIFSVVFSILFANDNSVLVKAKIVGKDVVVNAKNSNPFSVTVVYDAKFNNLETREKFPMLFVLKPQSQKKILKLHIKGKFRYKANYHWTIGSKDAIHDDSYIYRLPYELGTKRTVSQGFNGDFTHFGASQYAVDFSMPVDTKIYAAREGRVVKVKDDSNKGGPTKAFLDDANYVIIEHNDGTLATYAHLKYHGVVVKVGQNVNRGELIGYSGQTGMARGPHLHFIVYKAIDGKTRESFPIKFRSAQGLIENPKKGMVYQAK